jgi:hypothetical protein
MSDMDESAPVKAGAPSSEQHDAGRDADPTHGTLYRIYVTVSL